MPTTHEPYNLYPGFLTCDLQYTGF